jgi:hypothetical protein
MYPQRRLSPPTAMLIFFYVAYYVASGKSSRLEAVYGYKLDRFLNF